MMPRSGGHDSRSFFLLDQIIAYLMFGQRPPRKFLLPIWCSVACPLANFLISGFSSLSLRTRHPMLPLPNFGLFSRFPNATLTFLNFRFPKISGVLAPGSASDFPVYPLSFIRFSCVCLSFPTRTFPNFRLFFIFRILPFHGLCFFRTCTPCEVPAYPEVPVVLLLLFPDIHHPPVDIFSISTLPASALSRHPQIHKTIFFCFPKIRHSGLFCFFFRNSGFFSPRLISISDAPSLPLAFFFVPFPTSTIPISILPAFPVFPKVSG